MRSSKLFSDKELIKELVTKNNSIVGVMRDLGVPLAGGNQGTLKKKLIEWGVDTSHFTGQGWREGKTFEKKQLIHYLADKPTPSNRLKHRLIAEGQKEHKCYNCGLKEWMGQVIPIELEHIDGDHNNNKLENLTILCPNCHAQTFSYGRKKSSLMAQ